MAYITNEGARLIERASSEGKSIVFGSVRMNTTYKSDPASLVQQSEEWFGENHGSVVGCLSHVSVDDVSQVCDSKLAVQCNDNSKAWKSLGIYAHLDGEEGEELFACESIQNGGYEDVTIVEIPVTLDGVVADFGLSEGGSGGGGEVPANMMTTDTVQNGLTGTKTWTWENYEGAGSLENPQEGDARITRALSIADSQYPIGMSYSESHYSTKDDFWRQEVYSHLHFTPNAVEYNGSQASWLDIIKESQKRAPDSRSGSTTVSVVKGETVVFDQTIQPGSSIAHDGIRFKFDVSGYLEDVSPNRAETIETIGVIVTDSAGNMVENGRVSGVSMGSVPLTFQSPIQLADGYKIAYQAIFSSSSSKPKP